VDRCWVGAFVLASSVSALACTRVVVPGPVLFSAKDASVTVLRRGKPVKGAKVELLTAERWGEVPLPNWSSSTGPEGIISLPYLTPGVFELRLGQEQSPEATLLFEVRGNTPIEGTRSIVFEIAPSPARTLQNLAETTQIRAFLKAFAGIVEDPTDAVIPSAKISIKKRSNPEGADIAETATDQAGHFALDLPAGEYIGFFQSRGFLVEVVPFEIGSTEIASKWWEGVVLKLELGGGSDCVQGNPYSTKGELLELRLRTGSR
jgi:hypothetical protein